MRADYNLNNLKRRRNPHAKFFKKKSRATWNFRLVKHQDRISAIPWYGVHEVFYNDAGQPVAMTESPADITGESQAEVRKYLKTIQKDIQHLPILDLRRTKWAKW